MLNDDIMSGLLTAFSAVREVTDQVKWGNEVPVTGDYYQEKNIVLEDLCCSGEFHIYALDDCGATRGFITREDEDVYFYGVATYLTLSHIEQIALALKSLKEEIQVEVDR